MTHVVFDTAKVTADGKQTYTPKLEGQSSEAVSDLPEFEEIKMEDIEAGLKFGAESSVPRYGVDPVTMTVLHRPLRER